MEYLKTVIEFVKKILGNKEVKGKKKPQIPEVSPNVIFVDFQSRRRLTEMQTTYGELVTPEDETDIPVTLMMRFDAKGHTRLQALERITELDRETMIRDMFKLYEEMVWMYVNEIPLQYFDGEEWIDYDVFGPSSDDEEEKE